MKSLVQGWGIGMSGHSHPGRCRVVGDMGGETVGREKAPLELLVRSAFCTATEYLLLSTLLPAFPWFCMRCEEMIQSKPTNLASLLPGKHSDGKIILILS